MGKSCHGGMVPSVHDGMCDGRCTECVHEDCISDAPPAVDVDEYLQLHLEPDNALYAAMSRDLRGFCDAHGIMPSEPADVSILERAMRGGYTGKKLEKALYKVRNRDKYLAQKKRWRERRRGV